MLNVKVVKCNGLKKKDLMGKADPYVKLHLGGGSNFAKVTRTMKGNLNPEWNESFKLIVNDPQSQSLELHVYDWEKVSWIDTVLQPLGSSACDLQMCLCPTFWALLIVSVSVWNS